MMNDLLSRPAAKRVAIASVATLLFAGVVAVATHSSGGVGDARLRTKGHATVTSASGERRTVTGTVALHRGDVVEAVDDTIDVDLPDGSSVEGRTGYKDNDATRLKIAQPVELLAGEALVVSRSDTDVDAGGNRVHLDRGDGDSAARVSRALAVSAGVYRGTATLDSAGQTRSLSALRSIEVSVLGRPATPLPLKVNDDDPWDRRFLGEAMDLGHTLDSYASSYTQTLGGTRTPTFYRDLLPSLKDEDGLTSTLLAAHPHTTGDTIVGLAIAGLSRRGAIADRVQGVFDFRDAADPPTNWGLVALDQGVARDPLLAEVQQALNTSPFQFTQAAQAPPTPGGNATTTTSTPPAGGGNTTTTTPPNQPPPPTTTTIVPPTGQPLVDGLVDTVNKLLGGLLGGGGPPGP